MRIGADSAVSIITMRSGHRDEGSEATRVVTWSEGGCLMLLNIRLPIADKRLLDYRQGTFVSRDTATPSASM
jgi:hypothetical protein